MRADILCCGTCDIDRNAALQRKDCLFVLEKDHGLLYRFDGQVAILFGPAFLLFGCERFLHGVIHDAGLYFEPEDMADCIINALLRDFSALDALQHCVEGLAIHVGLHQHVDARVDRVGHLLGKVAPADIVDRLPVADDQTVEPEFIAKNRNILAVFMHLDAAHAAVADHDRKRAGIDEPLVDIEKHRRLRVAQVRVAPVDHKSVFAGSPRFCPIGKKVLAASSNAVVLQSFDIGDGEVSDDLRLRRIGLVGSAPSGVGAHRDTRRKVPEHSGEFGFIRRCGADLVHEVLVVRCAEADIVRKKDSASAVIDAMNVILSVYEGNAGLGGQRRALIVPDQVLPLRSTEILAVRFAQNGAEVILRHAICIDVVDGRLDHLANFLLQRQLGQNFVGRHA